jgi:hypothetical protein
MSLASEPGGSLSLSISRSRDEWGKRIIPFFDCITDPMTVVDSYDRILARNKSFDRLMMRFSRRTLAVEYSKRSTSSRLT